MTHPVAPPAPATAATLTSGGGHPAAARINARPDDFFDLDSLYDFAGPNPYLNAAALVFDFALLAPPPVPAEELRTQAMARFAELGLPNGGDDGSYAALFAHTVSLASCLDLDLPLQRWALYRSDRCYTVAVECLHVATLWGVVYLIWDWFEALLRGDEFDFETPFGLLQRRFSDSIYGGPTTCALLRAAHARHIPVDYRWEEGLLQYGYGRRQIRGASTSFAIDSHLDSDFTTRKDDCKALLARWGFPFPQGEVVDEVEAAIAMAETLGYPVVIKPLLGHKGLGVTTAIQEAEGLRLAFDKAVAASQRRAPHHRPRVIVERHVGGDDYRLLCINGEFVAALKRLPAAVIGDGKRTLRALIEAENARPERADTPSSALGKIPLSTATSAFLQEQQRHLDDIPKAGERVQVSRVANLSAGGVSADASDRVHPDNVQLCETIAQQFRLLCLGIDVLCSDIAQSWRQGGFAVVEINAAPGIFMHLNPAQGRPIDVPARIIEVLFPGNATARIPIITFNRLSGERLQSLSERLAKRFPGCVVGGICAEASWLEGVRQALEQQPYNQSIQTLLRHPQLDLLITECWGDLFYAEGMPYQGSDLLVLDEPSRGEQRLLHCLAPGGIAIMRQGQQVIIERFGQRKTQRCDDEGAFIHLCDLLIEQQVANAR